MEPDLSNSVRKRMSRSRGHSQTVQITTAVANVQVSGVLVHSDNESLSEDEEAVDALSLCEPPEDGEMESVQMGDGVIGIKDNHYSVPEGHLGLSSIEALESAVEKYKLLAKTVEPHSDRAKDIIRRLVQFRLKLFEAKEKAELAAAGGLIQKHIKVVMGHRFEEHSWRSAKGYCEKCNGVIIAIVQTWRKCTACGYCCHSRCMNQITRICASVKVAENAELLLSICPQKGLHAQNYRCAECRAPIGFQPGLREPRLCDYSGLYFCDFCHWNDTMAVPARILANWDFEPRKLSRASKQYLKLMLRRPILRIQDINPMLFRYLEELGQVKNLREEIIIMKQYFVKCNEALRSKLLVQLSSRQHFVDNSDMYSLQDLIDLANDVLLPELTRIHASFAQHIKTDCESCRSKGNVCSLCECREILFPFDSVAFVCPQCSTVVHRHCYVSQNNKCPECHRWQH